MTRLSVFCSIVLFILPQFSRAQQSSATSDTVRYISNGDTMQVTAAIRDSIMQAQQDAEEKAAPETTANQLARGFRYQQDFRNVPWGESLTTALDMLNRTSYDMESSEALAWYDTIAGDSVYVRLYFYEDQFWQASYTYLLGGEAGIQDYNKKFQRIEEVLVKKYGNPDKMRRITWDDSPYIGDVDAIAMGQGLYQDRWFFGGDAPAEKPVTMDLLLQGINFRPNLVLQYSKPAIIKKIEKVKKDTLIQYY